MFIINYRTIITVIDKKFTQDINNLFRNLKDIYIKDGEEKLIQWTYALGASGNNAPDSFEATGKYTTKTGQITSLSGNIGIDLGNKFISISKNIV